MVETSSPDWLGVEAAAHLVGKSISTVRRLLPSIEEKAPEAIRREPIEGKGGQRVLLSRSYLLEHFNLQEPETLEREEKPLEAMGLEVIIQSLERELSAKNRQIDTLLRDGESKNRLLEEAQRQAGELSERLTQFAALNAGLQNRLLALTEKAGERSQDETEEGKGSSPWYYVLVSVLAAVSVCLLLWLLLGWIG